MAVLFRLNKPWKCAPLERCGPRVVVSDVLLMANVLMVWVEVKRPSGFLLRQANHVCAVPYLGLQGITPVNMERPRQREPGRGWKSPKAYVFTTVAFDASPLSKAIFEHNGRASSVSSLQRQHKSTLDSLPTPPLMSGLPLGTSKSSGYTKSWGPRLTPPRSLRIPCSRLKSCYPPCLKRR